MRSFLLLILGWTVAGCQPVARYGSVEVRKTGAEPADTKASALPSHYSWLPTADLPDIPIVFIPSTSKEWEVLPKFWNHFPHRVAGARTIYLGLPPLPAAAALVMADHMEAIKLKVPLGLPDPTPHLPPANMPSYGKWRLGRKIFYDQLLEGASARFACASCHEPEHGFAKDQSCNVMGKRNTLSLLNVVYNKHQFWDGRVDDLEQVLVRSLEDERPISEGSAPNTSPEVSHVWGGLVKKLAANPDYEQQFKQVFGIRAPTQDSIARALATYMRTILSGDSLYDRADRERAAKGDGALSASHFRPYLNEAALQALASPRGRPDQVAQVLERGHKLFQGKAHCVDCHSGPLFTDQLFHNTGWGNSQLYDSDVGEAGRFAALPIGLKEAKFIGAYRTPTLRNLPRTGPYFHDGAQETLLQVIQYYDAGIFTSSHLDAKLRLGPGAQELKLAEDDVAALEVFLRSLDGGPGNAILVPGRN
jgi:cytochrome c peroxidase